MTTSQASGLSKVPAITLGFWIIKILATTFGETAGDTVSMSLNLGYLVGTAIFATLLVFLVLWQIRARDFHPALYWATIIASTTAGTTMADFATRSLAIGYPGGSTLLLALVLISLFIWYRAMGTISVASVHEPRAEIYYWLTITFSQTLGTALGDWVADGSLGYLGAAVIFGVLLALIALAYFRTNISHVFLFWVAFIITRPLGAVVGDFLDKPLAQGGLELSRAAASIVLGLAIVGLIWILPQRPGVCNSAN
ncbi:COG4705 family protein [Parasphingorhabdus sp.]|uniref:COG4705 family protein n=1 Tax=Parasphingorhabdus sp. TaxID=2709688 RepID=UPI00300128FF